MGFFPKTIPKTSEKIQTTYFAAITVYLVLSASPSISFFICDVKNVDANKSRCKLSTTQLFSRHAIAPLMWFKQTDSIWRILVKSFLIRDFLSVTIRSIIHHTVHTNVNVIARQTRGHFQPHIVHVCDGKSHHTFRHTFYSNDRRAGLRPHLRYVTQLTLREVKSSLQTTSQL